MNPRDDIHKNPVDEISAEYDATLQAIEALEARTVDPNPAPLRMPVQPVAPPVVKPTLTAEPVKQVPVASPVTVKAPVEKIVVPEPKKEPSTPSSEMAAALANAPATDPSQATFQPFGKQKVSKKPFIITAIVLVVIGLGVGGYFGWQYLQTQDTPTPAVITPEVTAPAEAPKPTGDTQTSVTNTITEIETQLNTIDDTPYSDETLSDTTLYN